MGMRSYVWIENLCEVPFIENKRAECFAQCRITVENRAYHYLSQPEIDGGKRIVKHLSHLMPLKSATE
jgi:hypothetical protein